MLSMLRPISVFCLALSVILGATYLVMGLGAVLITLFVLLTCVAFSMFHATEIVLRASGAKPLADTPDMPMFDILKSDLDVLSEKAGLTPPALYIVDVPHPNAFALGRPGKSAKIILTSGLLRHLNRVEVAGVVAHELAHIRAGDAALAGMISAFAAIISSPRALFRWVTRANRKTHYAAGVSFAPVADHLSVWMIGPQRELKADRIGSDICGDPNYLIAALTKIERGARAMAFNNLAKHPELAHLLTINPAQEADNGAIRTHPSTAHRISELRQLVSAG